MKTVKEEDGGSNLPVFRLEWGPVELWPQVSTCASHGSAELASAFLIA